MSSKPTSLPDLPLVCLSTAHITSTRAVVQGKNTVIDFWTTKCIRCPNALDKLDEMAVDPRHINIQFVSICCDRSDKAREIINGDDNPRWKNISHYFMDKDDKEKVKEALGFKSVPFCVVIDEMGTIVKSGSYKTINFQNIPGMK